MADRAPAGFEAEETGASQAGAAADEPLPGRDGTMVGQGLAAAAEGSPPAVHPPRDTLWDDCSRPPRVPTMPVLHLDGFDGPMDLLLALAERQRIDFGNMSVRALAEQFVAALEQLAGRVTIERRADWVVLAARLVLLRSRLMFPASEEEAAAAEREAAVELRRLGELAFLRLAAEWLRARPLLGIDVFGRGSTESEAAVQAGYVALMEACLVVLRGGGGQPAEATVYRPVRPALWRVADALDRIRAVLAEHPEGGELPLFLPALPADDPHREVKARAAVASTLLAGLALARDGPVRIEQEETCGTIRLQAHPDLGARR